MADPSGISGETVAPTYGAGYVDASNVPVQVFMEVAIDLSGNVDVLGAARPTLYQIVKCTAGIRQNSLHLGDSSGILEFWENGTNDTTRENIEAVISSTARNAADASFNTFEDFSGALYADLSGIFCNSAAAATNLNAVAAAPFSASAYSPAGTAVDAYTKFKTLGDMMLAWAAHYAFGHVAATAAIDNDVQIIKRFNSDLNVPRLFLDAIAALSKEKATRIARSVIAQDPERALNMDNNALAPFQHQALRFRAGDLLYLRINMAQWTVTDNYTNSSYAGTVPTGSGNPAGNTTLYNATSLVTANELALLASRLPVMTKTNTDAVEAPKGVFFHFEIPVVAAA